MRIPVILGLTIMAASAATAQEFYRSEADLPTSGRDSAFLDACWEAMKSQDGSAPLSTEAIMIPEYHPLTVDRMMRYLPPGGDDVVFKDGMVYADTTFVVWIADSTGVTLPVAIRCEAPFDPDAPDFSKVYLTEDHSLNPNIPADERPARE